MDLDLTPNSLLTAYAAGIFPMADEQGEIRWLAPDPRAIIELDAFKASRSLRSVARRDVFEVTVDRAFEEVIDSCADRAEGSWISPAMRAAYGELHHLGFTHSVESWHEGVLAGGLYGVSLGGAFFGESMFYRVTDASKVAMVRLIEIMRQRGFILLDVQFMTPHLHRFGAVEIPRAEYEQRLSRAIQLRCAFADASVE